MMQAKYRHAEKLKTLRLLLFDDNATNPFERHRRRGAPVPPLPLPNALESSGRRI